MEKRGFNDEIMKRRMQARFDAQARLLRERWCPSAPCRRSTPPPPVRAASSIVRQNGSSADARRSPPPASIWAESPVARATWPVCCPSSGMCIHLQACGRINDHAADCPCFHRINEAYPVVLLKSDQEAAQQRTGGGKSERLKRDHALRCHDNFPGRMQATAENLHFS